MIIKPFGFNLKKEAATSDPVFRELGTLYNAGAGGQTQLTSTIANVSTDDLILVVICRVAQRQITGVASTTPAITFSLIKSADADGSFQCDLWAAKAPSSAASIDVTATYATEDNWGSIFTARYSNAPASITPTQTAAHTSLQTATTNRTVTNIVTSQRSLIIAAGIDWNNYNTHTAASGWTKRADSSTFGATQTTQFLFDRISAAGTYPSGNFSTAASDQYVALIASFSV